MEKKRARATLPDATTATKAKLREQAQAAREAEFVRRALRLYESMMRNAKGSKLRPVRKQRSSKATTAKEAKRAKRLPFPPSFQKRLDRLRRRARNRGKSDMQIMRHGLAVLEALSDQSAVILRAKKRGRKK